MNRSLAVDTKIDNSYWFTEAKRRHSLSQDTKADIVVIGGGPAGLSAVYHLTQRGYDVVLLEAREVGSGGLGNSTGIVSYSGLEPEVREYIEDYGVDATRDLWKYPERAAEDLRSMIEAEGLNCIPHGGAVALHADRKEAESEVAAYNEIGMKAPVLLEEDVAKHMVDSQAYNGVLLYERDYSLDPLKFARGFAAAAERKGARVYEDSPVQRVDTKRGNVILYNGKRVSAGSIIVATNPYTFDLEGVPRWLKRRSVSVHNYVTHVRVTKTPNGRTPFQGVQSFFDDGLSSSGYTFGRVVNGDILIGSAESFCPTTTNAPKDINYFTAENISALQQMFPGYEFESVRTWGGKIAETPEGIPKMGEVSRNVYTTLVGDSISMAFLGGQLIAELIHEGRPIPHQLDINNRLPIAEEVKKFGLFVLPSNLIDPAVKLYAEHFD